MTVIIAAVKITNDYLLDVVSVQFENEEIPFDTYKDLYDSKLISKSVMEYLKDPDFLEAHIGDEYLSKVLNGLSIVDYKEHKKCFGELSRWKNVSCIHNPDDTDEYISHYSNFDGSPNMKVAQPPILPQIFQYYWFRPASPYAMRFLEIMRRIKETSLMHWPALAYQNRVIKYLEKINKIKINTVIEKEQLLVILSFGYFASVIAFVTERIFFKIKNRSIEELY